MWIDRQAYRSEEDEWGLVRVLNFTFRFIDIPN